ncbi:MBL fold metallo-hydrolase [candidate division WWE3 bacterium]|nr:MBL fold metallo-hydrolase [candidate division WWE3 bacterium]
MEISFAGHSCFKVKGKESSLVFDPYNPEMVGFKLPKLEADIVCVSHHHDDHDFVEGVKSPEGFAQVVIDSPGEYDVKGVYITGFKSFHDDKNGSERGQNTIYYVEMDGIFLLHLGDLGHMLTKDVLEEIETVHILMVPVGGIYTINYKTAVDLVSELEPYFVIPMHFQTDELKLPQKLDGVEKFLSEWGSDVVKKESRLKISGKSDMPEETQVVLLERM